jgi:hypothetical protein
LGWHRRQRGHNSFEQAPAIAKEEPFQWTVFRLENEFLKALEHIMTLEYIDLDGFDGDDTHECRHDLADSESASCVEPGWTPTPHGNRRE